MSIRVLRLIVEFEAVLADILAQRGTVGDQFDFCGCGSDGQRAPNNAAL